MKEFQKGVGEREIAEALGISKTTVSRALSGNGRVSEQTKARVFEYAKMHNYEPLVSCRKRQAVPTQTVGVVLPKNLEKTDWPYMMQILDGIDDVCEGNRYHMILVRVEEETDSLVRLLGNQRVDGMLIWGGCLTENFRSIFQRYQIPFVTIDENLINYRSAATQLTMSVIEKGIQKIAFVSRVGNEKRTIAFFAGYKSALRSHQMKTDFDLIHRDLKREADYEQAFLSIYHAGAECILCEDAEVFSKIHRLMREYGAWHIRLALLFGNGMVGSEKSFALEFDAKELGRRSARLLMQKMVGNTSVPKVKFGELTYPYHVIVNA